MQRPDLNWRQVSTPPHSTASHTCLTIEIYYGICHTYRSQGPIPDLQNLHLPGLGHPGDSYNKTRLGNSSLHILAQVRVTVPAEFHGRVPLWGLLHDVPAAGAHQEALARARDDLFECCRHSRTLHWWGWVAETLGRYTRQGSVPEESGKAHDNLAARPPPFALTLSVVRLQYSSWSSWLPFGTLGPGPRCSDNSKLEFPFFCGSLDWIPNHGFSWTKVNMLQLLAALKKLV